MRSEPLVSGESARASVPPPATPPRIAHRMGRPGRAALSAATRSIASSSADGPCESPSALGAPPPPSEASFPVATRARRAGDEAAGALPAKAAVPSIVEVGLPPATDTPWRRPAAASACAYARTSSGDGAACSRRGVGKGLPRLTAAARPPCARTSLIVTGRAAEPSTTARRREAYTCGGRSRGREVRAGQQSAPRAPAGRPRLVRTSAALAAAAAS